MLSTALVLAWPTAALAASPPPRGGEIRAALADDGPADAYRKLELGLLTSVSLDAATSAAPPAREVLNQIVTLAMLYEDRVAAVHEQTAVARAVAAFSTPATPEAWWVATRVAHPDMLRDHAALLDVIGDCIGAQAAWRVALTQCELGARAPRACRMAAEAVVRLGDEVTAADAAVQLEVAAAGGGAPMGICGHSFLADGHHSRAQTDVEVAAAVLRHLADTCSAARSW